jgi:HD-GYP domain-containing protein (c-di-GMP phosphodiesterase class II)
VSLVPAVCTLLLTASSRFRLYGSAHRLTREALGELEGLLGQVLEEEGTFRLLVRGQEVIVQDLRIDASSGPAFGLARRLEAKGVGMLQIDFGVRGSELEAFCAQLADPAATTIFSGTSLRVGTAEPDVQGAGGGATAPLEILRVQHVEGRRRDAVQDEARQIQAATEYLRDHYEVRTRDFRDIALALLSHLTVQGSLFLNLAEVRDHNLFTYLHTCNVATLSMGLTLGLGIRGEEAFDIGVAALLHDVGKNFIPESVLDKPGPLSEEEWELVRLHPVIGARLLMQQKEVHHLAVVAAYEHHMHFDGIGGYPVAGRPPALQSQLIAVVDTFDALFGKRSYHARYEVLEALEILHTDSGRVYNPEIVDEFSRYVTHHLDAARREGLLEPLQPAAGATPARTPSLT